MVSWWCKDAHESFSIAFWYQWTQHAAWPSRSSVYFGGASKLVGHLRMSLWSSFCTRGGGNQEPCSHPFFLKMVSSNALQGFTFTTWWHMPIAHPSALSCLCNHKVRWFSLLTVTEACMLFYHMVTARVSTVQNKVGSSATGIAISFRGSVELHMSSPRCFVVTTL